MSHQVAQQSIDAFRETKEAGEVSELSSEELGRQERRVLSIISHYGPVTRQEIAEVVDFKESTVCARARGLVRQGFVEEVYKKHVTLPDGRRVRRGVLDLTREVDYRD